VISSNERRSCVLTKLSNKENAARNKADAGRTGMQSRHLFVFTISWDRNTSELGRMRSRRATADGGVIMREGVSHERKSTVKIEASQAINLSQLVASCTRKVFPRA
jgi:hypothetical protein